MFDQPHNTPILPRAHGEAIVRLGAGGLEGLRQAGSAKAILPKMHGAPSEVVFLNTAGGVTGGDRLEFTLKLGAGVRATATTQTAERAYAALPGSVGRIRNRFTVGPGGALDWLPQETILFDRAALLRRTEIDLAPDASAILAETVVLGRAAMGETLRHLDVTDRRVISRAGRPVLIDALRLDNLALGAGRTAAMLADARALALIALVGQGAEDVAPALADLMGEDADLRVAASGWDGRTVIRATARDAWPLRRRVAAILTRIRQAPLPRVWQI